ncbi:RNA methyltransferase [Candidatus Falkowbacteria bacterium]|nr:RNA methyltransferase [Candidatus Falkowbacteria bacterium]NCQ13159.1 RNA methyltransferase [Candidatus Falkowbacteria bacterium]OIO06684.1 MAG: hypothetical protein AUJ26_00280 [Candidatus Falkowbacteria bacterium CG1_02_37_21]
MKKINSTANPIINNTVRLKKAGERKRQGLIVIDGIREIALALKSGTTVTTLFYCPSLNDADPKRVFSVPEENIIEVTEAIFSKISYKENPDGFLALALRPSLNLDDIKLDKNPLIIVLEKVEKPGNLGAILRTAYAVGATAVIINDNQTDIYNPNVIRASEGYVFSELVVSSSLKDTAAWLKKNKIKSFAAATSAKQNYTAVNWCLGAAIVLGSEADGLSDDWLKSADKLIKIPMISGLDSLNVSVAAAVIAFEALRQREL